jgi:hypothetical protein
MINFIIEWWISDAGFVLVGALYLGGCFVWLQSWVINSGP